MQSLCDFSTWQRKNLERVADEMLALIVEHELKMPSGLSRDDLSWSYNGDGRWRAITRWHDSGTPFYWLIDITSCGEFSVCNSDKELLCGQEPPHFSSLIEAKTYCEEKNRED